MFCSQGIGGHGRNFGMVRRLVKEKKGSLGLYTPLTMVAALQLELTIVNWTIMIFDGL